MDMITCKNCGNKQSSKWQFCHNCNTNLYPDHSFSLITKQTWINNVKMEPERMNATAETRATEAMLAERRKEMRLSRKARDWEVGRKKEVMNYKHTWVKRGRKVKDLPKT